MNLQQDSQQEKTTTATAAAAAAAAEDDHNRSRSHDHGNADTAPLDDDSVVDNDKNPMTVSLSKKVTLEGSDSILGEELLVGHTNGKRRKHHSQQHEGEDNDSSSNNSNNNYQGDDDEVSSLASSLTRANLLGGSPFSSQQDAISENHHDNDGDAGAGAGADGKNECDFCSCHRAGGGKRNPNEEFSAHLSSIGLIGRDNELNLLIDTLERVQSTRQSEGILVSGVSGQGKSRLVETLRIHTAIQDGYYCVGKFEQPTTAPSPAPFGAITSALSDLVDLLCQRQDSEAIGAALRQALGGGDWRLLANVVSNLNFLLPSSNTEAIDPAPLSSATMATTTTTTTDFWSRAFIRFKQLCSTFLRTVMDHCCSLEKTHPIVFAFDDVQWADAESLQVLKAIVDSSSSPSLSSSSPRKTSPMLHIWTYRVEDDDDDEKENGALKLFLQTNTPSFRHLPLGPMGLEDVNAIIAETTRTEPHKSLELANIVLRKTSGNIFFVLQFLQQINQEGFLVVSKNSAGRRSCCWNTRQILVGTNVCANVVDVLKKRIHRWSDRGISMLNFAAFLGFHFDKQLLETIVLAQIDGFTLCQFNHMVETALSEGFIEQDTHTTMKFSHDRIQQCFYEIVTDAKEKELRHLQIGRQICGSLGHIPEPQREAYLFLAADQYNRGQAHVLCKDERVELVRLNLRASQVAKQKSSFRPAASFIEHAVSLIDSSTVWQEHYELALELYTTAAQLHCALGDFADLDLIVEEVTTNARSFIDKEPVLCTKLEALGLQSEQAEGLHLATNWLAENDEVVPAKPTLWHLIQEGAITKAMLFNADETAQVGAGEMGLKHQANLKILIHMVLHTMYLMEVEASMFYILRMLRSTLNYGLSPLAPAAYAGYAMLCAHMGNRPEARKYRRVALKLLERPESKKCESFCLLLLDSFVTHWIEPIGEAQVLKGYTSGIQHGQVHWAYGAACLYIEWSLFSGIPLKLFEPTCGALLKEMLDFQQSNTFKIIVPCWQTALNFIYPKDDPVELTSDLMNEDALLREAENLGIVFVAETVVSTKLYLAAYFGVTCSKLLIKPGRHVQMHLNFKHFQLCTAIVLVNLLRRNPSKLTRMSYFSRLHGITRWMERQVSEGVALVEPLLRLVQAELASLKCSDQSHVLKLYGEAISSAAQHSLLHIEALANEKAGTWALLKEGATSRVAKSYLSAACERYEDWDGYAKVEQLCKMYPQLVNRRAGTAQLPSKDAAMSRGLGAFAGL